MEGHLSASISNRKGTFLQSFQYKVLNRIVYCNDKLFTWKIKTNNKCEYCREIDTIEHLLFRCRYSKDFWSKVQRWSKNKLDTSLNFTVCEILFDISIEKNDSFNIINFLILLGKQSSTKTFIFVFYLD